MKRPKSDRKRLTHHEGVERAALLCEIVATTLNHPAIQRKRHRPQVEAIEAAVYRLYSDLLNTSPKDKS